MTGNMNCWRPHLTTCDTPLNFSLRSMLKSMYKVIPSSPIEGVGEERQQQCPQHVQLQGVLDKCPCLVPKGYKGYSTPAATEPPCSSSSAISVMSSSLAAKKVLHAMQALSQTKSLGLRQCVTGPAEPSHLQQCKAVELRVAGIMDDTDKCQQAKQAYPKVCREDGGCQLLRGRQPLQALRAQSLEVHSSLSGHLCMLVFLLESCSPARENETIC